MAPWKDPFRKNSREEVMDREIAYHIEELTKANIAKGMSAEEARRQASIAFGGREQIKQQLREVNTSAFLNSMAFNLKSAMLFMRRSPSFSACAAGLMHA